MDLEHAGAGAGRRDDIVERREGVDHLLGDGARRGAVAGIVGRLAAAGLRRGTSTAQPASSISFTAAKPTVGRNRSTRQVTNNPTREPVGMKRSSPEMGARDIGAIVLASQAAQVRRMDGSRQLTLTPRLSWIALIIVARLDRATQ